MDRYAVIGNPIAHSKSPAIHRLFAEQCHQELEYIAIHSQEENFERDVNAFFKSGRGMNVTVPFKIQAMHLADQLSVTANMAGAVNTLIKQEDGTLFGDNTDGEGLVIDLVSNLKIELAGKSVIILGAGGATQGVLYPLLTQHVKNIYIANRTLEKAQRLSEKFAQFGELSAISMESLSQIDKVDILINASSAGLSGESADLPKNLSSTFCYDMIYSKALTPFLLKAIDNGCKNYADGFGMLVEQAAQSFYLWRNVRPDTQPVLKALRTAL